AWPNRSSSGPPRACCSSTGTRAAEIFETSSCLPGKEEGSGPRSVGGQASEQAVAGGAGDGLEPAVNLQLAVDALHALPDRRPAPPEPRRHHAGAGALGQEPQDLELAPRQAVSVAGTVAGTVPGAVRPQGGRLGQTLPDQRLDLVGDGGIAEEV